MGANSKNTVMTTKCIQKKAHGGKKKKKVSVCIITALLKGTVHWESSTCLLPICRWSFWWPFLKIKKKLKITSAFSTDWLALFLFFLFRPPKKSNRYQIASEKKMLSGILAALCKQILIAATYWPCNEIPYMDRTSEVLHQAARPPLWTSLSASAVEFAPWLSLLAGCVCLQQEEGRKALSYLPLSSVHHQQAHRADVFTNHIASVAASVNCCTVLAHTFVLFCFCCCFFYPPHIFSSILVTLTLNLWSLHPAEHKAMLVLLQLPLPPLFPPPRISGGKYHMHFSRTNLELFSMYMLHSGSIKLQMDLK